jgi:hypothetical protein
LDLKGALRPLLEKMVLSVRTMIELSHWFENMQKDNLFTEISFLLQNSGLDVRTQLNYELFFFSTGNVRLILKCFLNYRYRGGQVSGKATLLNCHAFSLMLTVDTLICICS